jgi:hypothetical protein
VTDRTTQLLELYKDCRVDDQLGFYRRRKDEFDRAAGQAAVVSAVLLGLTAATSSLAGASAGHTQLWTALAAILPALTTAVAAYAALFAFERQSKLYGDARRALLAATREPPNLEGLAQAERATAVSAYVADVEAVFRNEQGQWGQLPASGETGQSTDGAENPGIAENGETAGNGETAEH